MNSVCGCQVKSNLHSTPVLNLGSTLTPTKTCSTFYIIWESDVTFGQFLFTRVLILSSFRKLLLWLAKVTSVHINGVRWDFKGVRLILYVLTS